MINSVIKIEQANLRVNKGEGYLNPHYIPYKIGILTPSDTKKLRHREVKRLARGHIINKGRTGL